MEVPAFIRSQDEPIDLAKNDCGRVETTGKVDLLAPPDVHYREPLASLDHTTFCYHADSSRMHRKKSASRTK